jgi:heat shock protein HtpX
MWEQIKSNQVRSITLIVMMGILLLIIGYFIGLYFFDSGTAGVFIAIVVWAFMNLIAYFQGDSIILGMSGARKIGPQDHPRLYNVVEEMKIASGLEKMPNVYIIDDPALNAFSTGRGPENASVAITSSLLDKLNRDELQGVIGHEIGHIKNRDILFMMLASILLGSIVILSYYASRFIFFGGMGGGRRKGSSSGGGGTAQLIIIVVGILLMILAPIMAQLIYFAISRRREYLADASSALYTRYPEGLASALEKLANAPGEVKGANKATAPLYIVNPFHKAGMSLDNLTATHPPIAERVRILRSMAGASLVDYNLAYQKIKGAKSAVVPASELALADKAEKRAASAEAAPVAAQAAVGQSSQAQSEDPLSRTRQTSDLMWRMSNYKTINCENCGTRMRLPPNYNRPNVRCPHCGHVNPA